MPLVATVPVKPDPVRAAAEKARTWDPDRQASGELMGPIADLLEAAADLADAINRA